MDRVERFFTVPPCRVQTSRSSSVVLADIRPAAIEVQRQCRRADGRGLSGSRSRDRLNSHEEHQRRIDYFRQSCTGQSLRLYQEICIQ
jgi:hypothetical protein